MTIQVVASQIEAFIRDRFSVKQNDPDFNADVHIFDHGYVDSFGAVELTTFVEATFDVSISNSDLMLYSMNTVNQIASFVTRRKLKEI